MSIRNIMGMVNTTMPFAWDDSLSVYEMLGKLINKINEVVEFVNLKLPDDFETTFYETFREYTKDEMQRILDSGEFAAILDSMIVDFLPIKQEVIDARGADPTLGARLDWTDTQLANIAINVEDFREDGKTDADVIQDTFNHVESLLEASGWGLRTQIYFGNGVTYRIDKPLHFRRHKYTTIFGYGSTIVVDSVDVLPHMLDLSSEEGTYYVGNMRLKGLTFNANNKASKIIEGLNPDSHTKYGLYYFYVHDCQFVGLMENSYAIHGLSWACFLKDNRFIGYGEDPQNNDTHWRGTALHLASAANGVYVTDCNFSRLDKVATGTSVKVVFSNNIIDTLKKSAFLLDGAGLTIKDNYFEAVGGEIETVELYLQPSQPINAAIILRANPNAWNLPIDTVDISNNTIMTQNANDFVALANAINVEVKHNYFEYMSKRENLVRLFGDGIGRTIYALDGLKISDNTLYTTVSGNRTFLFESVLNFDLVEMVGGRGLHSIVVKDVVRPHKRKLPVNLYKNNFSEYESNSSWNVSEVVMDDEKVFKLEKISNAYSNTISLKEYLNKLKGQYVRVSFRQRNTQHGATLRFRIDDGINSELYIPLNSTSSLVYCEFLYKIDEDATDFKISFDTYADIGQSIYVADFLLSPAWYDLEMFE